MRSVVGKLITLGAIVASVIGIVAPAQVSAVAYPNGDLFMGTSSYNFQTKQVTNLNTLGNEAYSFSAYSFSPNGRLLAYQTNRMDGTHREDIVVTDYAGTFKRVVAKGVYASTPGNLQWSPDGTKVAFGLLTSNDPYMPSYPYRIGYAKVDGSGYYVIPKISVPITKFFGGLTWTTNSTIGYINNLREYCRVQLNGTNKTCVTMPGFNDLPDVAQYYNPKISPDGKKIVVQKLSMWIDDPDPQGPRWTTYDLWSFNVDGTNGKRLTKNPYILSGDDTNSELGVNMAWSPDGTKIAYGMGSGKQYGTYVMNSDGTNVVKYNLGYASGSVEAWRAKQ